jgi:hypothetical protein
LTDPTFDPSSEPPAAFDPAEIQNEITAALDAAAGAQGDDELHERSVADVIAELTADVEPDVAAPPLDMAGLRKLAKLKAAKTRYEAMAKALGDVIGHLETELVDNVLPHRGADGRWATTVGDQTGYLATTLWPKRRTDEDTGKAFETVDLVKAMRADGLDYLVADAVHGQTLAAWMRERVARWEAEVSESGKRNSRGELVDLDGAVLTRDEAIDPTDPDLALPAHVRRVLTVTAQMKIAFRQR